MLNHLLKILLIVVFSGTLFGCGVHAKVYSQDRARVDQELPVGTPAEGRKTTRKVYVLEVTKDPSKQEKAKQSTESAPSAEQQPPQPAVIEPPSQDFSGNVAPAASAQGSEVPFVNVELPVDYKIEKDDTLQSIAKKFYNSYGKWTKIYDANKDKLPDPNRIKPGTVITIPEIH